MYLFIFPVRHLSICTTCNYATLGCALSSWNIDFPFCLYMVLHEVVQCHFCREEYLNSYSQWPFWSCLKVRIWSCKLMRTYFSDEFCLKNHSEDRTVVIRNMTKIPFSVPAFLSHLTMQAS